MMNIFVVVIFMIFIFAGAKVIVAILPWLIGASVIGMVIGGIAMSCKDNSNEK